MLHFIPVGRIRSQLRSIINKQDRRRINGIAAVVKTMLPSAPTNLLDVGCGSGALAVRLMQHCPGLNVQGVDVVLADECRIPVTHYDGRSLPFADNSFDVVLCADMLHHTSDSEHMLAEAARVARHSIIVKDHIAEGWWEHRVLTLTDWIGNAGTGVPMPYNFLSRHSWQALFHTLGLTEADRLEGMRYWPRPISAVIDRNMHFVVKLDC